MFTRAVTLPSAPPSVWRALTEPGAMADWFGADVEIELRPGGRAHFGPSIDDAGRVGVVDDVEADRHLRFRWWPEDDDADVSEVSYDLVADDDGGTTLTVTERRVPLGEIPTAAAGSRPAPVAAAGAGQVWSPVDQLAFESWAGGSRLLVAIGR